MKNITLWTVDPMHTSIAFTVRHLLITNVRGVFDDVSGTVAHDPKDIASSTLSIDIPAKSIDTRQAQRDAHLRSPEFFDAEAHPIITFRSTKVSEREILGELTMRGITRPVTLSVAEITGETKDHRGLTRMGASATAKVKRSEYGMTYNPVLEAGGVAVADEIAITLDLSLVKNAA